MEIKLGIMKNETRKKCYCNILIMFLGFILVALLNKAVDFRSRRFAFRGAGAEPPRRFAPAGSHLTS